MDFLKGLLRKIISAKKKGFITDEQRKYIHKSLKEVEPRMKYLKTQKQRMEVAKVLKQIRQELKDLDKPKKVGSGGLNREELQELKMRGFSPKEIEKLGTQSARAVIWNDISRDEALGLKKGLVTRTHAVRQRNTPIYHITKPKVKMGEEEKANKAKEERVENTEEENAI